ncbi:MAG: gluconate 2-dehydrogenase subunit 3 family protein [Acidobacteriaceae bacterium]
MFNADGIPSSQEGTVEEKNTPNRTLRFQRRAILKMMMAAPLAGWMPVASLAAQVAQMMPVSSATEDDGDGSADTYQPKVLNPHEWRTIQVLSDRILPADENSGSASEAGVPEFLDDWLDYQRGEPLTEVRYGLAWLDSECTRAFQQEFVDCAADQQAQILDRIAYPHKAAPEDVRAVVFFSHLRDLVLGGYYTSEMGIRDLPYLGNEPQASWQGCPAPVLAKLGLV